MPTPGPKPHNKSQNTGNNKALWIILPILLVFVSITSFLAGTHIGRATDHRLGQMLDTIVLSPENEAANPNRLDFGGQIFYTDGTPCANRVIELHSDPKRTTTDSEGVFHFKDVKTGTHHLAMLDDSGRPEHQVEIHIDRDSGIKTGQVSGSVDSYQLAVSEYVIEVHIRVQLDADGGMDIKPEVYTRDAGSDRYMDADGREADPISREPREADTAGSAAESGEGKLDSDNKNTAVEESAARTDPGQPSDSGVPSVGTGENILPPAQTSPSAVPEPTVESPPPLPGQPTESGSAVSPGTLPDDSDSDSDHGSSAGPDHGGHDRPTPPAEPLDVQVQEKMGPVWQQNTEISLFADRTGAGENRKLMPGSKGSYEFLVSNRNTYGVAYRMQISAPSGQLLLPLRYRLKSDDRYLCGDQDTWLTADQLAAATVTLSPGEEREYLLEWQWLFAGGNDRLDTIIGSAADLEYHVIVMIQIEQIIA